MCVPAQCVDTRRRVIQGWRQLAGQLLPSLWLLLALLPGSASALKLEVEVEGVEGEEQKNVLAMLGIYQEQEDQELSIARLLALHRRAPDQIRDALAPFGLYRSRSRRP